MAEHSGEFQLGETPHVPSGYDLGNNTCDIGGCTLPLYSNPNTFFQSTMCILHSDDDKKDRKLFYQELEIKLEKDDADPECVEISLFGVIFPNEVDFSARAFNKAINFSDAVFVKGADFSETTFLRPVSFNKCRFNSEANFRATHFGARANFSDARFTGEARFSSAQFESRVNFSEVQFDGSSRFSGAYFVGLANFRNVQFNGPTHFYNTEFFGATDFESIGVGQNLTFQGDTFLTSAPGESVSFRHLSIETSHRLRFESVNLSRVSFLGTDISQAKFVGCKWPEIPTLPLSLRICRPFGQFRHVIFDELLLEQRKRQGEAVDGQRAEIALLYRQLQINYEANRQEAEAGDYYVGFMEMRRRDPNNFPLLFRMIFLGYRELAKYGEAFGRPLLWYLVIFSPLFALAYWLLTEVSYANALFTSLTAGFFFREVPEGVDG